MKVVPQIENTEFLKRKDQRREYLHDLYAKHLELKTQLGILIQQQSEQQKLKTMTDLGQGFFVKVKVPSLEEIFVNIGLGFHVPMTLNEALEYVNKKQEQISKFCNSMLDLFCCC